MPYDPTMDKVLATWENNDTGLSISIHQYGEGEPKLQIGPRIYTKKDGTKSNTKAGRLPIDDILWLSEVIEDVKDRMNNLFLEDS
ncbi:MAG: hypothetical protein V2J25_08845 [Desulfatiglans sp.]|jgi:hypothetical protein|nr:hypothetical protein [Thermodesulfobacteriota bacterium]MEE4352961.1 hypothetical protein [Desulfatiglans sp.]